MDLNLSAGLSKDELLKSRMDHVFNVWMQQQQHPYVQSVFVKENIKTWYDFQQFLNNPDEINAVKNRKGLEVFEEEYDGKLSYFWWKRFKHALSYVNELQIEKGPLNDGLVDIRGVDYNAFATFCDANPIFQAYSNDRARARRTEREAHTLRMKQLEAKLKQAEALRDQALFEAYRTKSTREKTNSEVSPSTNFSAQRDNLSFRSNSRDNLPFQSSGSRATRSTRNPRSKKSSSRHNSRHNTSSSSSQRKKKKKKSYYRGGEGDGGGSSDSSSSGDESSSISSVGDSLPAGFGGGKGRYNGAWYRHKPKAKCKLDPTQFPVLREQTPWVDYMIEVKVFLTPHGMSQLLDPTFVPIRKHAEEARQDDLLLYSMLRSTVKCTKGKEFLMSEVGTFSGQRVWAKLIEHYMGAGNIVAELAKDDAYLFINTPLPEGTSSNTIRLADAIAKWETHFATYVIRLGKPVKPADKLDFFRRYISNVKEFQVVFTMNNMVKLVHNDRGGKDSINEFQPDVIIALYKQHASLLDHNNKANMIERRPQIEKELNHINALRQKYRDAGYNANVLDFGTAMDSSCDDDKWYDVMMTHKGKFIGNDSKLPIRVHIRLTPEERIMWMNFTSETRELILNARSSELPNIRAPARRKDNNTSHVDTSQDEHNTSSADTGYDDMASIPSDDPNVRANVNMLSMLRLENW